MEDRTRGSPFVHRSEFVFAGDEAESFEHSGEESEEEETWKSEESSLVQRPTDDEDFPHSKVEPVSSFVSYASRVMKEREREAVAREQEKREKFRKLMGMDHWRGDDESIKTILSEEEEEENKLSDEESSSDASTYACLKTVHISDSQLKLLNIFKDYPVPEDPGLVPGFWVIHQPPVSYKDDGIQKFADVVKTMGLRPIKLVKEMLRTDTLNLSYYGLDPRIVRAICEAVRDNSSVQTIDLTVGGMRIIDGMLYYAQSDNVLTVDACCRLNDLLVSNGVISCLKLSGCRIGAEGAEKLEDGIATAPSLLELRLNRCDIGDEGLKHIASAIYHSNVLENVNLSNNRLSDDSAEFLKTMLTQTDTLKRLDLSWNSLSGKDFSKMFFQGLTRNTTLEYLNMSWNGLGSDCASFLCSFLAKSESLRELDLTGNRLTATEGEQIAKALSKNVSLEVLRIGDNPLEPAGALALVKALIPERSPVLQLRTLDLQNVWANKDIVQTLETLDRERPSLDVVIGGILSNYKLVGPNPRKIFLRRANYEAMNTKKKKLRRDFGHFVLTLEDEEVPRANFEQSVKRFKLKLSDSLVDEIANAFAVRRGFVDQGALKELYLKEFPDTQPPPPIPETKKKTKAGKKKAAKQNSPK